MKTVILLFVVSCAACGSDGSSNDSITYEGEPVVERDVKAFVHDFAAFAKQPMPHGTLVFKAHNAFAECSSSHLDTCPHESFDNGTGAPFYIVTDTPDAGSDLKHTSIAHELTHAMFGDPNHERVDLWGYFGLVNTWNGHPEGRYTY